MKRILLLGSFSFLFVSSVFADDDLQREYYGRVEVLEQKVKDLEAKISDLLALAENARQQEQKEQMQLEVNNLMKDKSDKDVIVELKNCINKKEFEKAIALADAFLDQRPSSIYCGMIMYYKGKCYLAQNNYESSATMFMDSYEKNKNGSKTPKALFLLAECFEKLNKPENRTVILKRIVKNYEGHRYAKKAAKALANSKKNAS